MKVRWGFFRETCEDAVRPVLIRIPVFVELVLIIKVICPYTHDWVQDKCLPHYTNPDVILIDIDNTVCYEKVGIQVIRILY